MAIRFEVGGQTVTVEGAAEERTLRQLVEAVEARNKQDGIDTKKINDAFKDLDENVKDVNQDLKELGNSSNSASRSMSGFGKSLVATAANIALSFVKAYDTMAEHPIQAGAALLQAQIDMHAQIDKLLIDMGKNIGLGIAGLFGPLGQSTQTTAESVAKFGKDIVDLGAQFYTLGNQMLAAEFEKRIKAMADFTKAGASFGGGMTEIGNLAHESGIGLANYAKAVANSRDAITTMGLSAGEAAKLVAKGYKGLANTLGGSGTMMLREELLALGFQYEEQGEIMSLFMAQQRRAGVALENLSSGDIARGTAEYAKNLKLISDITGKDAKRIKEKAQEESMRGALNLNAEQKKVFEGVFEGLARLPDDVATQAQLAYEQIYASGTSNVLGIVSDPELFAGLKNLAQATHEGAIGEEEAARQTVELLARLGEASRSSGQSMQDTANLMGVNGAAGEMARVQNALRGITLVPGEFDKSKKAIKGQSTATDELTKGYQTSVKAMTNFQNTMEDLATKELPHYANLLGKATEDAANTMTLAIKYLKGEIGLGDLKDELLGKDKKGNKEATTTQKVKAAEAAGEHAVRSGRGQTLQGFRFKDAEEAAKYGFTPEYAQVGRAGMKKLKGWRYGDNVYDAYDYQGESGKDKELERAELAARKEALTQEALKIVTAKENTEEERAAHNARIKEINKETAEIVARQQEKGWLDEPKAARGTPKPGKAKGGISEGPLSGYSETLHGREAVVPLPDNRGIPVQLDTGALSKQLNHQSTILNDILAALHAGNRNTSGILQQSY